MGGLTAAVADSVYIILYYIILYYWGVSRRPSLLRPMPWRSSWARAVARSGGSRLLPSSAVYILHIIYIYIYSLRGGGGSRLLPSSAVNIFLNIIIILYLYIIYIICKSPWQKQPLALQRCLYNALYIYIYILYGCKIDYM